MGEWAAMIILGCLYGLMLIGAYVRGKRDAFRQALILFDKTANNREEPRTFEQIRDEFRKASREYGK